MEVCKNYKREWWHFLLPNNYLLYKLCTSEDKTNLFLTDLVRFLIYFFLFFYLNLFGFISLTSDNRLKFYLYVVMLTLVLLNLIILIIVIFKKNLYSKTQIQEETTAQYNLINNELYAQDSQYNPENDDIPQYIVNNKIDDINSI